MNKKFLIIALLVPVILLSGLASANLIDNAGFETQQYFNTKYCCNGLLGCEYNEIPYRHPTIWNSYAQNRDFARSSDDSYSGSWSMKIWSQQPDNCSWDGATGCEQFNYTYEGNVRQDIYDMGNTSLVLTFWVKKCEDEDRPKKCTQFWYEDWYYGDPNEPIEGDYRINFQFSGAGNTTDSVQFSGEAGGEWERVYIDFSQSELDVNETDGVNLTLNAQVVVADPFDNEQWCIVLDEFNLDYIEPPPDAYEEVSEAVNYFEDMHTFWGLPSEYELEWGQDTTCGGGSPSTITNITMSVFNFQTSKGFVEIPYGNIRFQPLCSGCGSYDIISYVVDCHDTSSLGKTGRYSRRPYVSLVYDNGTSFDVSDQTFMMNEMSSISSITLCPIGGSTQVAPMNIRFPIYNWEDLDYVHMNISSVFELNALPNNRECAWASMNVSFDSNLLETRQIYSNPMTDSYEIIEGSPSIFPFLAIRGNFEEDNVSFCAWAFSDDDTATSTNNAEIWLYDSGGSFKSVITETISVDGGNNIYTIYDNQGNARWCRQIDDCTEFVVNVSTLDCFEFPFIEPELGDEAHVILESDPTEHSGLTSSADTWWYVGEEIIGYCEDYCLETDYYDGTLDENNVCSYLVFVNDTRCIEEEEEIPEEVEEALEPLVEGLEQGSDYINAIFSYLDLYLGELLKLILAIMVSLSIGISAMRKTENSQYNHVIGLVGILGGFMFFTYWGWMPIWIGIIMTILSGFLLVRAIVSIFIG